MNSFIQTIFLSDLLVVIVPGIAILAVTAWAYSTREYAGYVLGWLTALGDAHVVRMAPIVEDGPVKMVESGAILEYLLAKYGEGRFRPASRWRS